MLFTIIEEKDGWGKLKSGSFFAGDSVEAYQVVVTACAGIIILTLFEKRVKA